MEGKQVEFLILGQGFAGTALAFWLEHLKKSYVIISDPEAPCASAAAVGLVNPVTGRRLAKSWNVDYLFPLAKQFYQMAYAMVHPGDTQTRSYFEPMPIVKALHAVEEANFVSGKSSWPGYENLLNVLSNQEVNWPFIFSNTHGWCEISSGGRLRVRDYLNDALAFFQSKGSWKPTGISRKDFVFEDGFWHYQDFKARIVVSCLGLGCPWLKEELRPVKGQVLEISGLPLPENKVLKTEKFFLPQKNGWALCGSTYENDFEHVEPDENGQREILRDLKQEFRSKVKVERAWAGVRPTTEDRQPVIREIMPGFYGLNGMGTKGVSLSPWSAWQLLGMVIPGQIH